MSSIKLLQSQRKEIDREASSIAKEFTDEPRFKISLSGWATSGRTIGWELCLSVKPARGKSFEERILFSEDDVEKFSEDETVKVKVRQHIMDACTKLKLKHG